MPRIGGRALAALLPDLRAQPGPVYAALCAAVTALVLDARIAIETRLPSERELAGALGVSRATVTAAYDALRASGFMSSRTGSGSFVTVPPGAQPSPSLLRWSTYHAADVIDLSCAALPGPDTALQRALAAAAAALPRHTVSEGYEPAGLHTLRAAIAQRFTLRGVPTTPEQIMVTGGALHAWDLVLRLLGGPGDRVVIELPTYPGAVDGIRRAGVRAIPVPMAAGGGWDVAALRSTLRQTAPRLAYLMPDFHNPTGALVDADARRDVLRAARHTGTTVVVDESFVDMGFCAAAPASASIDPTVVTIGSLSKPVWGGLRIGWIRAASDIVQRLAVLRAGIDLGGPVFEQLMAVELFDELDVLMAERVDKLRSRRDALVAALGRELPTWRFSLPQGGLSLWAELDAPLSTQLTLLAAPAGVIVVPGSRFGVDGTLERFLRLPYTLPETQLEHAVQRLAAVWRQLAHTPGAGAPARQLIVA
jgi:DNA-binding transcriptional MocR family regulator